MVNWFIFLSPPCFLSVVLQSICILHIPHPAQLHCWSSGLSWEETTPCASPILPVTSPRVSNLCPRLSSSAALHNLFGCGVKSRATLLRSLASLGLSLCLYQEWRWTWKWTLQKTGSRQMTYDGKLCCLCFLTWFKLKVCVDRFEQTGPRWEV